MYMLRRGGRGRKEKEDEGEEDVQWRDYHCGTKGLKGVMCVCLTWLSTLQHSCLITLPPYCSAVLVRFLRHKPIAMVHNV